MIDIAIGFVFLGWGVMLAVAPSGLIGLLGLATLAGVLPSILGGGDFLADHSLGLLGLLIALGIGVAAHLLHAGRLYGYAVLLFVAFAGGEALNGVVFSFDAFILSVMLAGSLILLSGLVILVRFLRKYPVPAIEA